MIRPFQFVTSAVTWFWMIVVSVAALNPPLLTITLVRTPRQNTEVTQEAAYPNSGVANAKQEYGP